MGFVHLSGVPSPDSHRSRSRALVPSELVNFVFCTSTFFTATLAVRRCV